MLDKIKITNFQNHIDTDFTLHPKITVITGASNSGKTAIARAFEWFSANRPRGFAFKPKKRLKSKGATNVAVTIDNVTGTHTKSDSINQYALSTSKQPFDVVGSDVPTEITQFLNINRNSIQGQHDTYFLLQDTPGEVAKQLNKIADLEIIDYTIAKVNSAITVNTGEVTNTQNRIVELDEQLNEYEHLDRADVLLTKINTLIQNYDENEKKQIDIEIILSKVEETTEVITGLKDWLLIEDEFIPILKMVTDIENTQNKSQQLESIIDSITELKIRIQSLSDVSGCEFLVKDIVGYATERKTIVERLRALETLFKKIAVNKSRIDELNKKITEEMEHIVDYILQNKVCPLCGGKIDINSIKHIEGWF